MSYRQSNVVTGHHGVDLVADLYPQSSTEKPSVILLHGGGQNRHAWAKTARTIHAAGHHVVAYDARGHGDSSWDPAGRYETEDLAYDLLAVRERYCGRRPAVAVGASIGGMTTLIAHRIAPPRLWAGVVLVDVTPRMEIDGARRVVQFMSAHPDGFATLHDAGDVIAAYNPHRPRPTNLDGLAKNLRQGPDGRWRWHWDPRFVVGKFGSADETRFTTVGPNLLERSADALAVPTLLVRGRSSDLLSEEGAREFLERVPHAEFADVAGAGHMVVGDRNEVFNTAVLDFLDRHRTRSA